MRLNLLMRLNRGPMSESNLGVAEAATDLVLAVDRELIAEAHSRKGNDYDQVKSALVAAETALNALLVPGAEQRAETSNGASG